MKLIIVGPQASGKGTQAEMLAKEFGMIHFAMGERLRQEVASHSHLGQRIKESLDRGEMVPDQLVENLVRRVIQDHPKFILDGFPRRIEQAKFLDLLTPIDHVILLRISDKEAIARIGGRRVCPKDHNYHIIYQKPKVEGICDVDGLPLKKRSDDTAAAIMNRLQHYHLETEPILEHYRDKVIQINGEQSIKDVHLAIMKALRHS